MTDYPDALYNGTPPHEPVETSEEAALNIAAHANTLRLRVLRHIVKCGARGAMDDEIEVALELRHQTASARRRELVLLGSVVDSGFRDRTRSGRRAIVWVAR